MWLELKAGITIIGCFIYAILLGLSGNIVFVIIGIMGIATFIFGDMLLGYKLITTDAINLLDPTGPNEKLIDLHLISGRRRILVAKKGPQGTWQFLYNKFKASVIDSGRGTYRFANGNPVIHAHEGYDKNIDPVEAKYLELAFDEYKVDNVIDLYTALKKEEKTIGGSNGPA